MPNPKARKLKDVLPQFAPEGTNDAKWSLLEHQVHQTIVSLASVRQLCERIGDAPENTEEWELARTALEIASPVYVQMLQAAADITALLADTEVAERVGRKEL